jgi:predicted Zn-dependent protease
MKGVSGSYALAGFVLLALLPSIARGQSASVRGSVVDEQGAPLPGVQVEMEFLGESRQKIVKKQATDKKGGFVRVGIQPGRWRLTFTKEGFNPAGLETDFSLGGVSEIVPVTLKRAPTAAASSPAGAQAAGALAAGVKELEAIYAQAVDALNAGRLDEAEALLKQILEKAPDAGPAHYTLGLVGLKKNDLALAESAFRKDVELRPGEPKAYVALATLLGASQRAPEALSLLQGAAGSFSDNATFLFALGVAAINAGREDEALPALAKAAELDPANAEAQYYLGTLAMGRNDVPTAITHLKRYLEVTPQGPNAAMAGKLLEALTKAK